MIALPKRDSGRKTAASMAREPGKGPPRSATGSNLAGAAPVSLSVPVAGDMSSKAKASSTRASWTLRGLAQPASARTGLLDPDAVADDETPRRRSRRAGRRRRSRRLRRVGQGEGGRLARSLHAAVVLGGPRHLRRDGGREDRPEAPLRRDLRALPGGAHQRQGLVGHQLAAAHADALPRASPGRAQAGAALLRRPRSGRPAHLRRDQAEPDGLRRVQGVDFDPTPSRWCASASTATRSIGSG